jgi:hypothetical protein
MGSKYEKNRNFLDFLFELRYIIILKMGGEKVPFRRPPEFLPQQ